ncbi:hypothetical protein GVAV_001617 [Gurleya vavrai]
MGDCGKTIDIDEIFLYSKCKSHRGRSLTTKTDALCILEFDAKITQVYSTVIENKKAKTLILIIFTQVAANSKI